MPHCEYFANSCLRLVGSGAFLAISTQNAESARLDVEKKYDPTGLISYMETELLVTPLELLARAAARPDIPNATALALFENYDGFLDLIDNEEHRNELSELCLTKSLRQRSGGK